MMLKYNLKKLKKDKKNKLMQNELKKNKKNQRKHKKIENNLKKVKIN